MGPANIVCDQAIFTSIRTPTGEGYRIIAASKGIRAGERQCITRRSPSHDALCKVSGSPSSVKQLPHGAAFYKLPSDRFCLALSCCAGAEHTGRGGQRIYTHNILFELDQFIEIGFDPIGLLQAMEKAGLNNPQLKPPASLDRVELAVQVCSSGSVEEMESELSSAWKAYTVSEILSNHKLVLNTPANWSSTLRAIIAGLPGPMRSQISFSAGLKFSLSRDCSIVLLTDDRTHVTSKTAGRSLAYHEPDLAEPPTTPESQWLTFVQRHWDANDADRLMNRTSRAFAKTDIKALDDVGHLFNALDSIAETDSSTLLQQARERLGEPEEPVVGEISAELVVSIQREWLHRLDAMTWEQVQIYWADLVDIWRSSKEGCLFAIPLIESALDRALKQHPSAAAEAALDLVLERPPSSDDVGCAPMVERVLSQLADWADGADDGQLESLPELCRRWRGIRPICPIVNRLHERCLALHDARS